MSWMTVTEYNKSVAAIRRSAGVLLDAPSMVRAALTESGVLEEAVAKLPPILECNTETRLRELVASAPIELPRDADFIMRAGQECEDAIDELRAALEANVKAAKVWDDLVAAGRVRIVNVNGNPVPRTAYEKAAEAQRAKSKLRLVKDDEA